MLSNIVTGQCCGCDTGCDNYNDCPELPENELPESINFEFTGTASYLFPEIQTAFDVPCDILSRIEIRIFNSGDDQVNIQAEVPRLVLDDGTKTKEYFKFFPPGQRQQFTIFRNGFYKAFPGAGTPFGSETTSFETVYEIVGIYVAPIKTISQTVPDAPSSFGERTTKLITETENIPESQGGPYTKTFYDLNHNDSAKCLNLGHCYDSTNSGFGAFLYGSIPSVNIHGYPVVYGMNAHGQKKLSSGEKHTLSIKADGSLWAWGDNEFGQLGINSTTMSPTPVQVGDSYQWSSVACGSFHSIAIKKDGTIWVWGKNNKGQLGLNDTINRLIPTQVNINGINVAAGGGEHTLVIRNGGEYEGGDVWSWGSNEYGQLGYTTSVPTQLIPKKVPQLTNLKSISCGLYHSAAIATIGTQKGVYCWGNNEYGQVGVNSTLMQFTTPQLVTYSIDGGSPGTIPDVDYFRSRLECGGYHTSLFSFGAIDPMEGRLWMWGRNLEGQLATDTPPNTDGERNELSPVQIELPPDTSMFESVGCGKFHTVLACRGVSNPPNTELYFYSVNYDNVQKLNLGINFGSTDHKFKYSEILNSALISCGDSFTHFIAKSHFEPNATQRGILDYPLLWSYANNFDGHRLGQLGHNFGNNWHGSYDPLEPSLYLNTCMSRALGVSTSGRDLLNPECPSCLTDWEFGEWTFDWAKENCNECKPVSQGGEMDCIRVEYGEDHYPAKYAGTAWFADIIIQPAKVMEPPISSSNWGYSNYSYFNSKPPIDLCAFESVWFTPGSSTGSPVWALFPNALIDPYGWEINPDVDLFSLQEWQKTINRFTSVRRITNNNNASRAGLTTLNDSSNCPLFRDFDESNFSAAAVRLPILSLEDFKNPTRSNAAQRIQYLVSTTTDEWTKKINDPSLYTVPDSYHRFGPIAEEFIDSHYSLNPTVPIVSRLFVSSPMKQNKLPETISLSGGNLGLPYGIYKPNIATKSDIYIAPNCKKPCFGDENCYDERWCCDTPPSCLNQACCAPNFEPGCPTNTTCEAAVCAVEPFCCGIVWDTVCATIALDTPACNCPKPVCGGATHDCQTCSSNPGCNDADCCSFVCGFEPACCTDSWSPCCVEIATFFCGSSGDGTGCDLTCDEWRNQNPNWGQSDDGPTGNTGDNGTPAWCKSYKKHKGYKDLNNPRMKNEKWPANSDEFFNEFYSIYKIPDANLYPFKYTWDPSLILGLGSTLPRLWYDAADSNFIVTNSDNEVITLRNKSTTPAGNPILGRDASATNEISRPTLVTNAINNKNIIAFDGRDNVLLIPSSGIIGGGTDSRYSIFIAYRPKNTTDPSRTIFGNKPAGNLQITPSSIAGGPNANEVNIVLIQKTGLDPNDIPYVGGKHLETWLNGERKSFVLDTTNPYQSGSSSVWALGGNTDGFNKLEFDFCEIIIYPTNCIFEQRQLVEGYLAHKWGATDKLPDNHPWKNDAPSPRMVSRRAITTINEQLQLGQTCHHPYYKNTCLSTNRPLHEIYSVFPLPPGGVLEFELCNSGDGKYAFMCRTPKINGEYVLPPLGQPFGNDNCALEGSTFEMPPFATTDLQIIISPVEPPAPNQQS